MHTLSNDNAFAVGTQVAARVNPTLPLIIHTYYQRIYYCAVISDPSRKHLAYYERELIAPTPTGK